MRVDTPPVPPLVETLTRSSPRDLVIRCLRRRLWQALEQEDGDAALEIYTATRADWEKWIEEREPEETKGMLKRKKATKMPQRSKSEDDLTVPLLQRYINPSDPFLLDDYRDPFEPYLSPTANNAKPKSFWRRNHEQLPHLEDPSTHPDMTTPLHEAARMGHVPLLKAMLAHPTVDPNARNTAGRTALIMVAGGLTNVEDEHSPVGIRRARSLLPVPPDPKGAKRAANAVGRFFRESLKQNKPETPDKKPRTQVSLSDLAANRLEAAMTVLAWSHPNDGSERAGQGLSLNTVDTVRGRTALHYAAELGRAAICDAILESFGAILTIVDDQARTPCELAAERHHDALAAVLEARALLYVDPYGMDDQLLAAVLYRAGVPFDGIVAPFCWFETCSMARVQQERESRLVRMFENIKHALKVKRQEQIARQAILNASNTSLSVQSASLSEKEDCKPPAMIDATQDAQSEADQAKQTGVSVLESNDDVADVLGRVTPEDTSDEERFSSADEAEIVHGDYTVFEHLNKSYIEMYLKFHGWNEMQAVDAFVRNPFKAFREANVPIPGVRIEQKPSKQESPLLCLICCEEFDSDSHQWKELKSCDHGFCAECLGSYITNAAKSKSFGLIIECPHHECKAPLSLIEIAELSPSGDVFESLLDSANQHFIASAHDFRFCPHPGCSGIVKFNVPPFLKKSELDPDLLDIIGAVCTACSTGDEFSPMTYEGLRDSSYCDCRSTAPPCRAHRFCFACGEKGFHWPVTCEQMEQWKSVVREKVEEAREGEDDVEGANENFTDIAQKLWLKTNTRPCPKCRARIEKNEGCNHMTCSNPHCKHEFCWICRNDWKLHNTQTGGFFRCNRWVDQKEHQFYDKPPEDPQAELARLEDVNDPSNMTATYGTAMHEARVTGKKARAMSRFLHHYERWNAHAESAALEQRMGDTVCTRLAPVVRAAIEFDGRPDFNFEGKGISYVHAAFVELKECRSMLQHSYVLSYFRYSSHSIKRFKQMRRLYQEKFAFEQLQGELEMMTEQMSDVVARSHLRATQSQIVFLTATAAEKRKEFSNLVIGILQQERNGFDGIMATALINRKKNKKRNRRRIPGLMDNIAGLAHIQSNENAPSLFTAVHGSESGNSNRALAVRDEELDIEEAIRASLADLNTSSASHGEQDGDDEEQLTRDWACGACTYVNAGGHRCAVCGTASQASLV